MKAALGLSFYNWKKGLLPFGNRNLLGSSYSVLVHFVALMPSNISNYVTDEQASSLVRALNNGFNDTTFHFDLGAVERVVTSEEHAICRSEDTFKPRYRAGNGSFDILTVYLCNPDYDEEGVSASFCSLPRTTSVCSIL